MDTTQLIADIEAEISKLTNALVALKGQQAKPRIGRPPKLNTASSADNAPIRRKRKFSARQRKEQSARAKAMWKARRAAKGKAAKS